MQLTKVLALMAVFITVTSVGAEDLKIKFLRTRKKRAITDNCAKLHEAYSKVRRSDKIRMYFGGKPKRINVMSTYRAPSRAMAALLAAAFRHKAGYTDVYTVIDNRTMNQLANANDIPPLRTDQDFIDDKVHIHVDADWKERELGEPSLPSCTDPVYSCSIAGPRLLDIGRTPSVNIHLYSVISNKTFLKDECLGANTWNFFQNMTNLERCDFLPSPIKSNGSHTDCIPIFIMEEIINSTHIGNLQNEFESFKDKLSVCEVFIKNRTELNIRLRDIITSFLFVDYELGYENNNNNVQIVQMSPQLSVQEPIFAMRLADHFILRRHAPVIEVILSLMRPQPEDLREILSIDASLNNIDDAACKWAYNNQAKFKIWTNTSEEQLWFVVILCQNPDLAEYIKLLETLKDKLRNILKDDINLFNFTIGRFIRNCSDELIVSNLISGLDKRSDWKYIAGLTLPGSIKSYRRNDLQYVLHNTPLPGMELRNGFSTTSGSLQQLTNSIRHFFTKQGWSRVAIISEKSAIAESITSELSREINHKKETLEKLDEKTITETLLRLQKADARVFFINAESMVANLIVCEAAKLGMVDEDKYAWIARDWRPSAKCQNRVQVFSVSYWWHGGNDTLIKEFEGNAKIRELLNSIWKNTTWPILAAPMVDAILLMLYRVQMMMSNNYERLYDLHSQESIRAMAERIHGNVSGVVHKIQQVNHMQHNPLVYVTTWKGNVSNLVAIWGIQNDTDEIKEIKTIYEPYYGGKGPDDGKTKCMTLTFGDAFFPYCLDPVLLSVIILLAIVPAVVWKTRQVLMTKLMKRDRQTLMRLLLRCENAAAVLEPLLIDRSDLELYEELGSGHFGRVRFGMLRLPNCLPTPVAAKALRKNAAPAEEAEFLREASILATLSHDHIVGLVKVCADAAGPPLLLMDHAFFGDLLKYLRQRRHLVEINEGNTRTFETSVKDEALKKSLDPEARYVCPTELTRLAREAAEALDYISGNHIVHRDIRACNCLIDARRVLKLADFGMARNIESKSRSPLDNTKDSDYKYICCRRGVFPVPWMAPESLERGEFSRASDVWALGMLMLEIATLGARPYGSWKPMQVYRFVCSGGRPILPRDASYHTCEVIEMCWAERPRDRATAKDVVDYLVARPTALRGALRPAWPEPNEVPDRSDSGFFGERTSEQNWLKGSDLLISTL